MAGALKSGANGLAGVIDLINNPHGQLQAQPSAEDVKAGMEFYRSVHPGASAQQAAAFVQKGIDAGRQPVSSNLKDASDFLRSAGQPTGWWENVGAAGEQLLEYIGGEGLLKLASAPAKVTSAAKAGTAAIDTIGHITAASQVAKTLQENPRLAGLVSIALKASKDAFMQGAPDALVTGGKTGAALAGQNYLHYRDPG
jgi:hypothetical protein